MTTPPGRPAEPDAGPPQRSSRLQGRPVQRRAAGSRRVRGRFRRTPLLIGVLVVAVVSGAIVFVVGARPDAELIESLAVDQAYAGTSYAFDGLICVGSQVVSATVKSVDVEQSGGARTRLLRAPDGPPTLGFPVRDDGGAPLDGLVVAPGERDCTVRLLVTPTTQGQVLAGKVSIRLGYGPGGLLTRTVTLQPRVTLDVTGTGRDPRLAG